jgi:hypothetical protein
MALTLTDTLLTLPSKVGTIAFASNHPLIGSLPCKVKTGGSVTLGSSTTELNASVVSVPTPGNATVIVNESLT